MKKVEFNSAICLKLSDAQRKAVEHVAMSQDLSLGAATRKILQQGIESMGIKPLTSGSRKEC